MAITIRVLRRINPLVIIVIIYRICELSNNDKELKRTFDLALQNY